jgi:pimeloyl-ACP methyl ester carboxylesterase
VEIRTGTARSGDLDIYYEEMGDPNDPAVLLIMGLGAQLLLWRTGFCELLVNQGLRVIRYDNRDVGLSSKVEGRHTGAKLLPRLARSYLGKRSEAVYTLEHMADDAAALLDHLQVEKAHIVGGSMGGMIAQVFAARYQHRTKTLAVIFSSNNQALLPPPGLKQLRAITTRPKDTSREGIIANAVAVNTIIGSPGYPAPAEQVLADATEGYERSYYPAGIARHFSAIMGSGSLLHYDKLITAPTVVIHGRAD